MRKLSEFSQVGNRTVFAGLLVVIFLVGLFAVAGPNGMDQQSFAAEPPPADQAQAAENMPPGPSKGGEPPEDCDGPPITCVGADITPQNPFPGCTSGQRCTPYTTGKTCGTLGSGKKCQTVNNGSGVCSCQCIK